MCVCVCVRLLKKLQERHVYLSPISRSDPVTGRIYKTDITDEVTQQRSPEFGKQYSVKMSSPTFQMVLKSFVFFNLFWLTVKHRKQEHSEVGVQRS